jgi:integrase
MQKGSVIEYKQKDGDVVYRVQYRDAASRQVKETIGRKSEGWTKRKVQAELAERIARVAKKGYRRPDPVLFSTYADTWFEQSQVSRGWDAATVKKYRYEIERLKGRFRRMRLSELRRSQINEYGAELLKTYSARSVNLTLSVLGMILAAATEEELIDSNPAERIRRPRIAAYKPRALRPEELRRVEAELKDEQVKLAFRTFALLGLRWSELTALRWRDIDFLNSRLRVEDSKTPTGERSVAIPPVLLAGIEEHFQRTHYRHENDYVFCHAEKGTRWYSDSFHDKVKPALKEAGIEGRFRPAHDLRVTSLTTGVLANENPAKLMARAGHRSFATTKRYIDLAGQVFPEEAEALASLLLGTPAAESSEV